MYRLRETDIMIKRDNEEGDDVWIKNDPESARAVFSLLTGQVLAWNVSTYLSRKTRIEDERGAEQRCMVRHSLGLCEEFCTGNAVYDESGVRGEIWNDVHEAFQP